MESNMTIEDKLNLIRLTYSDLGTIKKFTDDIYGIVNRKGSIHFINLNTMELFEEECGYDIINIFDNTIVLYNIDSTFKIKSVILDRKTFNILFESNKKLGVTGDIIYEANKALILEMHKENTEPESLVLDSKANIIYKVPKSNESIELDISQTDNENYYIITQKFLNEDKEHKRIIKYNKEYNIMESMFYSADYDVIQLGCGLILFEKYGNRQEAYIYDIINKKLVD